jgi:hypothetical protein
MPIGRMGEAELSVWWRWTKGFPYWKRETWSIKKTEIKESNTDGSDFHHSTRQSTRENVATYLQLCGWSCGRRRIKREKRREERDGAVFARYLGNSWSCVPTGHLVTRAGAWATTKRVLQLAGINTTGANFSEIMGPANKFSWIQEQGAKWLVSSNCKIEGNGIWKK